MTNNNLQKHPTSRLAAASRRIDAALAFVGLWLWYGLAMMTGVGLVTQAAGVSMANFDSGYYAGMSIVALVFAVVHRLALFPQCKEEA